MMKKIKSPEDANGCIPHHPISDLFPLMLDHDIKEMAEDVKQNGLQQPIVIFEGKILDGRHRHEACRIAGVQAEFVEYAGDDPIGFVMSANFTRRHLEKSQLSLIAAKRAKLEKGWPNPHCLNSGITQTEAAKTLGVSRDSVQKAKKILEKSKPLAKAVAEGKLTINAALKKLDGSGVSKDDISLYTSGVKAKPNVRLDSVGREIPGEILVDWDRAAAMANRLRACASEIKVSVEKGLAEKDIIFAEMTNPTISDAAALHYSLSQIAPYSVCPVCQGRVRENCQLCRRRGWISKYLYGSPAVGKETRAIIEKSIAAKNAKAARV